MYFKLMTMYFEAVYCKRTMILKESYSGILLFHLKGKNIIINTLMIIIIINESFDCLN